MNARENAIQPLSEGQIRNRLDAYGKDEHFERGRALLWAKARDMYRDLHSLFRWDSKPVFVQAIKLSMDLAGRHGGVCRPPRGRLAPEIAEMITRDTQAALAKGYR